MPYNQYIDGQILFFEDILGTFLKLAYEASLPQNFVSFKVGTREPSLSVPTMKTILRGNTYSDLVMGAGDLTKINELSPKGALIKFINVMVVNFYNESFTNIGAYTVESLTRVI